MIRKHKATAGKLCFISILMFFFFMKDILILSVFDIFSNISTPCIWFICWIRWQFFFFKIYNVSLSQIYFFVCHLLDHGSVSYKTIIHTTLYAVLVHTHNNAKIKKNKHFFWKTDIKFSPQQRVKLLSKIPLQPFLTFTLLINALNDSLGCETPVPIFLQAAPRSDTQPGCTWTVIRQTAGKRHYTNSRYYTP